METDKTIRFTGHDLNPDKLLSKRYVLHHLRKYGATDRTLADIREKYNKQFTDELVWLYPISDGCHQGGFFLPVQEGFLWLPYDSADWDRGELFELEDAALMDAEGISYMIEDAESYFGALVDALKDAQRILIDRESNAGYTEPK